MNGHFSDALPEMAQRRMAAGPAATGSAAALFRAATGALRAGFECLLLWQERVTLRHRLTMMDDHMCRDIGRSRAEVEAEARKPFWQH